MDETTILTAAHCLPSTDHLIVFGTNKRGSTLSSGEKRTNTVGIKSVNIIGNIIAGKNTWNNDWAIVKLAKPLQFGPTVAKAELGTWKEFEQYVLVSDEFKLVLTKFVFSRKETISVRLLETVERMDSIQVNSTTSRFRI